MMMVVVALLMNIFLVDYHVNEYFLEKIQSWHVSKLMIVVTNHLLNDVVSLFLDPFFLDVDVVAQNHPVLVVVVMVVVEKKWIQNHCLLNRSLVVEEKHCRTIERACQPCVPHLVKLPFIAPIHALYLFVSKQVFVFCYLLHHFYA